MSLLQESIVYLLAAVIAVPISKRLGLGSVLGYLAAGIVIGPYGLALISDAEHILHFAELGVVFLLFIIGLELQPSRLWVLRRMVFGLGSAQVVGSAALISAITWSLGFAGKSALIIGFILALSSTAFVLQLLAEQKKLTTEYGRASFAILLFQDLAVIPMIAVLPLLSSGQVADSDIELWGLAWMVATIAAMIVGGRYLLRPVLRIVASTEIPELFTATALAVVIGAALLMELAGMSMVLGAFIAGMLLADSEYRHGLEADIAPFKGLLLGLFFIAVGMSVNLRLLLSEPLTILVIVSGLMAAKALVLFALAHLFRIRGAGTPVSLAVVLSQGGEFAFVLFGLVAREQLLEAALIDRLVLAVAVSMLVTPIAFFVNERLAERRVKARQPDYDTIRDDRNLVIIAGFGRFGQIVGRILQSTGRPFTALESDLSQIDVVRRYGNKVYYGDASKLELLRAAGVDHARVLVLAIDDVEASVRTAEAVARHFPHITIIARARNRRHQYRLMDIGIRHICRETLLSSLAVSELVLKELGLCDEESHRVVDTFREHDARLMVEQHAVHHDEERLIQTAKDTASELESLLRRDAAR